MASIQLLLISPVLHTRFALEDVLAPLQTRRKITSSQAVSIIRETLPRLPCALRIEQRTPKGITYAAAGTHRFIVNQRAKITQCQA